MLRLGRRNHKRQTNDKKWAEAKEKPRCSTIVIMKVRRALKMGRDTNIFKVWNDDWFE